MTMSDFKAHLWKVCCPEVCEGTECFARVSGFFFQRKWPYCAGMCLSGGLYEWRSGRLYLSHEYFCLWAKRPQHRKHIRQANPQSHPPPFSSSLSLSFLASFTPSLSVFLLSWELYIQAVMLLGLLPEPPRHTPLKTQKVIEMQHFLSSLWGWPLILAQNWLFSTLMHPCF